jgi:hypothetical protein
MIVVLAIGGFLGWKVNRARDQRLAVAAIQAKQGKIAYDYQMTSDDVLDPKPISLTSEPHAPRWLRRAVGNEFFQEVAHVDIRSDVSGETLLAVAKLDHLVHLTLALDGAKVDVAALGEIAKTPTFQSLILAQQSVNDAAMAKLAGARRLRRLLVVGANDLTDAGLASLADLPALEYLEIHNAPRITDLGLENLGPLLASLETLSIQASITDEGMACLRNCRKLKTLALGETRVSDAGLAHLSRLESLETLSMGATGVTDDGLAALRGLKNLKSLSLRSTKVHGPGLAHLEGLVALERLSLARTSLLDEGLETIARMKALKWLTLWESQVSPEAIDRLQAARPTLKIDKFMLITRKNRGSTRLP